VTHENQCETWFRSVNPQGKIPALSISQTGQVLWESQVILQFLEDSHVALGGEGRALVPLAPLDRAHMRLVVATHDLYLASPNCTQPGAFTHTQGCMYVPPPHSKHVTTRWIDRPTRAAKLRECWKQLDVLESLCRGPFFCGDDVSLADLTVFPTVIFFLFFTPRVFGWEDGAVFHGRPRLKYWFEEGMIALPAARRVHDEVTTALLKKEPYLEEIREEAKDSQYKWVYP